MDGGYKYQGMGLLSAEDEALHYPQNSDGGRTVLPFDEAAMTEEGLQRVFEECLQPLRDFLATRLLQ